MSSPKVITFTAAPFEESRATNVRQIAHYLALMMAIEERLLGRLRTLAVRGVVIASPFSVDALQHDILPVPSDADGAEALRRVHAAWLALKHQYGDQIDAAFLESEEEASSQDRAATHDAARELVQRFKQRHGQRIVARSAADDVILAEIEGLAKTNVSDMSSLQSEIDDLVARTPAAQLAIALRTMRISYEEDARRARAQIVRERLDVERLEEHRRESLARIEMIGEQLSVLDDSLENGFRAELDSISRLAGNLPAQALDEKLANVQRTVEDARRRAAMEGVVRKVLRRLGYEEVAVLQTLTPEDVRSDARVIYYRDPKDPERFVELAFAEDDALSVEVVRAEAQVDSSQRGRDTLAQKRLCEAMTHVERVASEAFAIAIAHETEPGVVAGFRGALRNVVASKTQVREMRA